MGAGAEGAGGGGGGGGTYSAAVLADSPALYWRLNDPSGTTATDSSGNARTGTYGAGVTLGVAGATTDGDTAVTLNASSTGRITSAYNPFAASFTVEGWANQAATATTQALFGGVGTTTCYLERTNTTNGLLFDPNSTDTTGRVSWTTWPVAGGWVHWALTYDSTTFAAELFINGVSSGALTTQAMAAAPGNFVVGGFAAASNPFNGTVDEIAIYTGILSSARIAAHYAAR